MASLKRQLGDMQGLQAGKQALMAAQNQVRHLLVHYACGDRVMHGPLQSLIPVTRPGHE